MNRSGAIGTVTLDPCSQGPPAQCDAVTATYEFLIFFYLEFIPISKNVGRPSIIFYTVFQQGAHIGFLFYAGGPRYSFHCGCCAGCPPAISAGETCGSQALVFPCSSRTWVDAAGPGAGTGPRAGNSGYVWEFRCSLICSFSIYEALLCVSRVLAELGN